MPLHSLPYQSWALMSYLLPSPLTIKRPHAIEEGALPTISSHSFHSYFLHSSKHKLHRFLLIPHCMPALANTFLFKEIRFHAVIIITVLITKDFCLNLTTYLGFYTSVAYYSFVCLFFCSLGVILYSLHSASSLHCLCVSVLCADHLSSPCVTASLSLCNFLRLRLVLEPRIDIPDYLLAWEFTP